MSLSIEVQKLSKSYDYIEFIFRDLDGILNSGEVTAITGKNGSGKSTLLKIIAGQSEPTKGSVNYIDNGKKVKLEKISYVAPYYNLYEDYTPLELYKLVVNLRNEIEDLAEFENYLSKFELIRKRDVPIKNFSSGMKQRLKIILNLIGDYQAYFFDEPSSNLDIFGIETLKNEIEILKNSGKLVAIATNEENEISWCNNLIRL
ncbi:MAG: ABC transporter ATP-binding protein [Candidatus Kapaibacterium sp.]|nr:ABC transporter ATP-binding protein [Ignavibacteriota bacterium]MCB9221750.1 ABC transporter ATP-binding protein [Ignavibacteria bacterium]